MFLLVAGTMFIFTACNSDTCSTDCAKKCCTENTDKCDDDCAKNCCTDKVVTCTHDEISSQKACCLGCKATEGEASCSLLAAGDHSCCIAKTEANCCCGDETCDGSCHGDAAEAEEAHTH